MFQVHVTVDESALGVINRLASAVEAVAGRQQEGISLFNQATGVAPSQSLPTPPANTPPAGPEEGDDAGTDGKQKRVRVSQAMRDETAAAIEVAGLVLNDVERALNSLFPKWSAKDCEKAMSMVAEANAKKAQAPSTAPPAQPVDPGQADLATQAQANVTAGVANTLEQADALMGDQRRKLDEAVAIVKAKIADPKNAEALFKFQLKQAFGDSVEFPHQAVCTPSFDENFARLMAGVNALPPDQPAAAPAAEPTPTPAPEAAVDPANAARIAYLSKLAPIGEKFAQATKDLIITLLSEGKPIGVEDARAFCIATAGHNVMSTAEVSAVVRQFAGSVDALGPDQIMPFIDALIAAADAKQNQGAF